MHGGGELRPGDTFERYAIVRLIAAGGMGEVYEATHTFTGRPVALKILPARQSSKEDAIRRAKIEAVVLSRLDHPNVVKVHDAGMTASGAVWIAMELLEGRTLRAVLHATGPMPVAQALYYGQEIADGIAAAHEIGAIHRDLKPENVFVTSQHQVKVLDLGTAKLYGSGFKSTERHRSVGTPAYMAPEQILGEVLDGRVDVYALGLVLYEAIAGRHALAGKDGELPNSLEWGVAQMLREPAPLAGVAPGCPAHVATIVERAIRKKRDERFASMTELAGALRAARERVVAEVRRAAPGPWTGEPNAPSRPGAQRAYVPPHAPPERITAPLDPSARVLAPAVAVAATPSGPSRAEPDPLASLSPSTDTRWLPSTQPAKGPRPPVDPAAAKAFAATAPSGASVATKPASAVATPAPVVIGRAAPLAGTLKSDTGMPLPASASIARVLALGTLLGLPLAGAATIAYRTYMRAAFAAEAASPSAIAPGGDASAAVAPAAAAPEPTAPVSRAPEVP